MLVLVDEICAAAAVVKERTKPCVWVLRRKKRKFCESRKLPRRRRRHRGVAIRPGK